MIKPGSTLGMLGGGQLGRLFTSAALNLGYQVIVVEPDADCPAGQIATKHLISSYDDESALQILANECDVITTEFENIPADVLNRLSENCQVFPSASAVQKAQDRMVEKQFILSCGLLPVPYGEIKNQSDIAEAVKKVTFPAILKTAQFGYDGKGQHLVNSIEDVQKAFIAVEQTPCVLEQRIDLDREISVILGRNEAGESESFPVAENIHVNGILHQTLVPANISNSLAQAAQAAAKRIADKLDYVGVIAVEFFVTKKGELLVNEMAPRTHNSGHYTLDTCVTSQFEQQVRMVCGLPFGDTRLLSPIVMTNMLGDLWQKKSAGIPDWQTIFESSSCKLHLYGKKEARMGRKMGHYCVLDNDLAVAKKEADKIFMQLSD